MAFTHRLSLVLLLAACGPPPLALVPTPIKVGHDAAEVHDVGLVDPDRDGDMDLLVATEQGLRYLRCDEGKWHDETLGTSLELLAPVHRLHPQPAPGDFLAERQDGLLLLQYSGIGSWREEPAPEGAALPLVLLAAEVDLDRDGRLDQVSLDERALTVEMDGVDVTAALGLGNVRLVGDGVRLHAADLDGDGDQDLLAVGGRILALLNNGGSFTPPARGASIAAPLEELVAWFTDVTKESGLDFVHHENREQWDIRPTMGPGVAFADVDLDGDEDLFVAGGIEQSSRLYLNGGDGRFEDGTARWGLASFRDHGMGALFADFDDDGDPDLYLSADGPDRLLLNEDGRRFADVTQAAGLGDERWGASAAAADYDRDGDLDLFVCNYLVFDLEAIPEEHPELRREDPIAMLPYVFPGPGNALHRNEGAGEDGVPRFTDVTVAAGMGAARGKSLGALWLDADDDGFLDLFVANDTTPDEFWSNRGDGTFVDIALQVGLDDPRGGMGLEAADLDGDFDEDIVATYWQTEPDAIFRNNHVHPPTTRRLVPRWEDIGIASGIGQATVGYVGWGSVLADLDGDADRDLFIANGYTSPDYETSFTCIGQADQLFENVTPAELFPGSGAPARHWKDVPKFALVEAERAGPHFARLLPKRGAAAADVDGDGDIDLAVTTNEGPLILLRNERGGRFLRVIVEGDGVKVPRDAPGARVLLRCEGGGTELAVVRVGSSYLSCHERGVRFGLGARQVSAVDVLWPDGMVSQHPVEGRGGTLRIRPP